MWAADALGPSSASGIFMKCLHKHQRKKKTKLGELGKEFPSLLSQELPTGPTDYDPNAGRSGEAGKKSMRNPQRVKHISLSTEAQVWRPFLVHLLFILDSTQAFLPFSPLSLLPWAGWGGKWHGHWRACGVNDSIPRHHVHSSWAPEDQRSPEWDALSRGITLPKTRPYTSTVGAQYKLL